MIKTYKANTNVSINVVLTNKKNLHISFTPLSNGSSTFTTDNEQIIEAIERHYNYGKLFKLYSSQDESKHNPKKNRENDEQISDEESEKQPNESETVDDTQDVKKVKVSDLASAKDYLADTFGISRTVLRGMKSITEQAAAHGIEFEGLS